MPLLVLFVLVPVIEITLFIKVGGLIGLGWTIALVLTSAIAGSWLVRQQGMRALADLTASLAELRDPAEPLAHGALILFAGALLLTPGFFTDIVGLLLLLAPVRRLVLRNLSARSRFQGFEMGPGPRRAAPSDHDAGIVDGEFTVLDPEKRAVGKPSGWTRH